MKSALIGVLDRHDELTGDGKPTGRIVVILGEVDNTGAALQPIDEGCRYVIGHHPGTEATVLGYQVNKVIAPRTLQLQKGFSGSGASAEIFNKISELEKTDPEAAKELMDQLGQGMQETGMDDITDALSKAWREIDPVQEFNLTRQLLKYTTCPAGHLNSASVFDKWFVREKLRHLKPLRDEVIEHNRFLDMMDGLF